MINENLVLNYKTMPGHFTTNKKKIAGYDKLWETAADILMEKGT